MPGRSPSRLTIAVLLLACGAARGDDPDGTAFFEQKIRPVLVRECYDCHAAGARKLRGGLLLDTRAGVLAGGESGPAIVPGKPEESLLLEALRHEGPEMPPRGKLPPRVVDDFSRWIAMGAPDPRKGPSAAPRPATSIDLEAGRRFWAYRPPVRHDPPKVVDESWPAGEIDRFVLARLEGRGLHPSGDADRATLARRLWYDLTGLPPSPEEVADFSNDPAPDAYERRVDRLLDSARFGQRWGRHWLDVVRFAESLTLRGFLFKEAWRYRDHVIDSFNADRPFDRFLAEQIAGDLLTADSSDLDDRRRGRIATTFLVLGNINLEDQDKGQLRMDVVDEQLDVFGKAFLAQTIGCARCHDHKFDPIPTRDYYAMAGILRNVKTLQHANVSKWIELPLPIEPGLEAAVREHEREVAVLKDRIKAARKARGSGPRRSVVTVVVGSVRGKAAPSTKDRELRRMEAELKRLEAIGPRRDRSMAVIEQPERDEIRIHIRGSVHTLGDPVPRGFLRVASIGPAPTFSGSESGRRELAAWVASRDNPLTARVIVNRAWHWLIGAGLVRTTDNFGRTGEAPSHPELLDNLAVRFMERGWSIKDLARSIVLSRTYRLTSVVAAPERRASAVDPENRLLWRMNRRRLDAECLRDTMLAVGGRLDSRMGGPSFPMTLNADYGYTRDDGRRSVYQPVFRNALPELFEAFDFANPSLVVGVRNVSTTATQALYLLNHPFAIEQARAAARLLARPVADDARRVDRAFRLVLGRPPSPAERRAALDFLRDHNDREAWTSLFQSLFASVDFRYVY